MIRSCPRRYLHITRSLVVAGRVLMEVKARKDGAALTGSLRDRLRRNERDFAAAVPDQFTGRVIRLTAAEPVSMEQKGNVVKFLSPEAHLTTTLACVKQGSVELVEGTTIYMMYREDGKNKAQDICDPVSGKVYKDQHYIRPAYFRDSAAVHRWLFGSYKQPPFLKHFILSDPERSVEEERVNVAGIKQKFTHYNRAEGNCSYPAVQTIMGIKGPFGLIPQRTMAGIFLHKNELGRKIVFEFGLTKHLTRSGLFPELDECGTFNNGY